MKKMNKKTLSWALMILGLAVLVTGLVLRFWLHKTEVSLDAAALCLIGLSLSLEYGGGKFRIALRVFQGLAGLIIVANVATWFVAFPHPAVLAMRISAIAVNLPLAALGLKKSEKTNEE